MTKGRKKRFSINQTVVFRFSGRNLVGKIQAIDAATKTVAYDILGEDGKLYAGVLVDVVGSYAIDTNLTRLFYKANNLDELGIPDHDVAVIKTDRSSILKKTEEKEEIADTQYDSEGLLYEVDPAELS
jgi:hypothetical protein